MAGSVLGDMVVAVYEAGDWDRNMFGIAECSHILGIFCYGSTGEVAAGEGWAGRYPSCRSDVLRLVRSKSVYPYDTTENAGDFTILYRYQRR